MNGINNQMVTEIRAALTEPKPYPGMSFVLGLSTLHMEVLKGTKVEMIDRSYQGAFGHCKMIFLDHRTGEKYEYTLKTLAKEGNSNG